MTQEEQEVVVAHLSLLLQGLGPHEIYKALLSAGIYAPGVGMVRNAELLLQERGLGDKSGAILSILNNEAVWWLYQRLTHKDWKSLQLMLAERE